MTIHLVELLFLLALFSLCIFLLSIPYAYVESKINSRKSRKKRQRGDY